MVFWWNGDVLREHDARRPSTNHTHIASSRLAGHGLLSDYPVGLVKCHVEMPFSELKDVYLGPNYAVNEAIEGLTFIVQYQTDATSMLGQIGI